MRTTEEPTHIICTWDQCGKLFHDSVNYINHVDEHSAEAESIDGESLSNLLNEYYLIIDINIADLYMCQFASCDYITKTQAAFVRHVAFHSYHERIKNIGINVVERQRLPKCIILDRYQVGEIAANECRWHRCNQTFDNINEFLCHVRDHTKNKQKYCRKGDFNKCEWLGMLMNDINILDINIKIASTGCSLKFTSLYKLIDHLRSHTTEKVIACPICGNLYSSKTRFADHRRRQIPSECKFKF